MTILRLALRKTRSVQDISYLEEFIIELKRQDRSTVFSPDIVTILYIILADETYILVLVMVRVCSWFDFPSFSVCLPFGTTIPHSCCWGQFQSSLTYRQPLVIGPSSNGMMVET